MLSGLRRKLEKIRRSGFFRGWILIVFSAFIPLGFSHFVGIAFTAGVSATTVEFTDTTDYSSLIYYLTFSIIHVALCVVSTFFVYDVLEYGHSAEFLKLYKLHHKLAFTVVSVAFVLVLVLFDTNMEQLSFQLVKKGIPSSAPEFFSTNLPIFPIAQFYLIPLVLVVAAFFPASAIMLAIPGIVKSIKLTPNDDLEMTLKTFGNRFQFLYSIMIILFVSASLATIFYLRVPFSFVNSTSTNYLNLLTTTYSVWVMVYFCILASTFIYTYSHFTSILKSEFRSSQIVRNEMYLEKIDIAISGHLFFKQNSILALGSFSPLLTLLIAKLLV